MRERALSERKRLEKQAAAELEAAVRNLNKAHKVTLTEYGARLATERERAKEAGRDPEAIPKLEAAHEEAMETLRQENAAALAALGVALQEQDDEVEQYEQVGPLAPPGHLVVTSPADCPWSALAATRRCSRQRRPRTSSRWQRRSGATQRPSRRCS